jgi:hypothetical protein
MAPVSVVANAVRRNFLMVDITPDDDCIGVAPMLQKRGWSNIIRKLMPVANAKDDRFRDDAHPDLPLLDGFILPPGRIRKAATKTDGWVDEISTVPYDTVEKNVEFMRRFMWKPGVIGDLAAKKGQLLDSTKSVVSGTPVFPDLVFLSSHGYPDGAFQQHYKRVKEPEHDHDYHIVFKVPELDTSQKAVDGWETDGKLKWVIFAACNALRPELAYQWAQGLRRANGPRGVLGFYDISPGPAGTVTYMSSFFANESKAIVDAWGGANGGNPWAGLVFESARNDTFATWSKKDLSPDVDNAGGKILYFHKTFAPKGCDVEDVNPKKMFGCAFVWVKADNSYALVSSSGGLKVGETFLAFCYRPGGAAWPTEAEALEVSLVNLRETWLQGGKTPPDWGKIGLNGALNWNGETLALADLKLKSKFTEGKSKDTVVIPKSFLNSKVALKFTIPSEAFKLYYGHDAKLWFKGELVDGAGKVVSRGSSIPYGLMILRASTESVAPG